MARNPDRMQRFRPFASGGLVGQPVLIRDDRRDWVEALAGETIGNELIVNASGYWDDWAATQTPGMQSIVRLTTPRPEPIHISFNSYFIETVGRIRFDYQRRHNAQCRDATAGQWLRYEQGRFIIEWGAGKARNFAILDMAPGSFQIPIASWAQLWGWSAYYPVRCQGYAQVGYSLPAKAYATYAYTNNAVGSAVMNIVPWARKITPNFYDTVAAGQGRVRVSSANGIILQEYLVRSPHIPNDQALPVATPVDVPIVGDAQWISLFIDAIGTLAVVSATLEISTG